MVHGGDVGLARARLDEQCRRIARHPDEEENRHRQQEQRQQAVGHSPADVMSHDVLQPRLSPFAPLSLTDPRLLDAAIRLP
jgi:hypothetical protein